MRVFLDEFLNYLAVERGLSPLTIAAYRSDLLGLLAFLEKRGVRTLDGVTRELIGEHLMAEKRRGLAGSSLSRFLAALKVFFRFLASNRYVRADITEMRTATPAAPATCSRQPFSPASSDSSEHCATPGCRRIPPGR